MAKELMKENPESRQAEGKNASENSDVTKAVKKTTVVPTPEASPVQGYDVVKMVDRTRQKDSPEETRQRNNKSRDLRSNLGKDFWTNV